MEHSPEFVPERETDADPVDWFAREILKHPDQAEALKKTLRDRLDTPRAALPPPVPSDPHDADDFWDNVPV